MSRECGMFAGMRALLLGAMLVIFTSLAKSQDCPRRDPNGPDIDSSVRTLTGKVAFHDNLRQWLSLEVKDAVCGERIVQLIADDKQIDTHGHLEVLRGCTVTVTGRLGLPGTVYYSAEIYQQVESLKPADDCRKQPELPEYSKMKPRRDVSGYRVKLWFDYYGPQGPLHGSVTSGDKQLNPWQAYVSYFFNGEEDLTAGCAEGFFLRHWRATPAARPSAMDNHVLVMPEWAAQKHVRRITVSYFCKR
jgi:hypothetical protein